jgi:predicted RNA methylase
METRQCWLNPTVTLRWRHDGLVAESENAAAQLAIPPAFVPLLDCYREPIDLEGGVQTFLARYADEDDAEVAQQLRDFVGQLQHAGIVVSESGEQAGGGEPVDNWFAKASSHLTMLADYVRTATYRESISRNVDGKNVVEVGCGSGILAVFAVKAGAKHLYAIEETPIIEVAREVARRNGVDDRIEFIASNSKRVTLPEPVDVVYSEIIGSDPLGEDILPALRDAASRFLKPGGTMIPNRLAIRAVCLQSAAVNRSRAISRQSLMEAEHLSRLYDVDLSPLLDSYRAEIKARDSAYELYGVVGGEPAEDHWVEPYAIISDEQLIAEWDLREPEVADAGVDAQAELNRSLETILRVPLTFEMQRNAVHNCMAVYFDVDLDDRLFLTNSPYVTQPPQSWGGQLMRPVDDLDVAAGDKVTVETVIDPALRPTIWFSRP